MNIVLVLIDSLSRHYLTAYGNDDVATPALDRFAQRARRFDNHFVGSLPCMPARREIFAGRKEMMWRPWGPLEPFDARLPRLLEAAGTSTALVTDHYHYWEEAANGYMQSFQSAELIRGHESDFWRQPPRADDEVPAWVSNIEAWRGGRGPRQFFANVEKFETEEDFFPAKVMTGAVQWLRENATKKPFYLHVESFDVHEPFLCPEPYASMYWDGAGKEAHTVWPPYQDPRQKAEFLATASEEALGFIRAQYAGKVTMLDRWFGTLLDQLDRDDLWSDTVVIVTTDHGHDLGHRGAFGKQYPHFDSHANIPLLVWHPSYAGTGEPVSALTSTVDLFATLLDVAEAPIPEETHSRSLLPLLSGEQSAIRESLTYGTFGQGVCCTDGDWTVFKSPVDEPMPLYSYSSGLFRSLHVQAARKPTDQGYFIPGVELPQWQVPVEITPLSHENFLFHRAHDPGQEVNRWADNAAERTRMTDLLRSTLDEEGTPAEQFARLGLKH